MISSDDNSMVVEGYALKFDRPATHDWTEVIDKNALRNCDMSDVCMKYNHSDNNYILARTKNNSLKLDVDDIGLKIRAELIDTTTNKDIYKMVKSGLLDKMSFAFTVSNDEWDYESDTRRILEIDKLYDVAIVDIPFYDSTEIYARNNTEYKNEKEKYLLSKKLELEKAKLRMKLNRRLR